MPAPVNGNVDAGSSVGTPGIRAWQIVAIGAEDGDAAAAATGALRATTSNAIGRADFTENPLW